GAVDHPRQRRLLRAAQRAAEGRASMRQRTIVWLVVFLCGALGLALNARVHPGFGTKYVRDTDVSFVQVTVGPPIGADAGEKTSAVPVWLKSDDYQLKLPNVHRTDAAPISWTKEEVIPATQAWSDMDQNGSASRVRISWPNTIGVWVAA